MIQSAPSIGELEPVPVRELWKHEERGFSAWLETNLDTLSKAIGKSLSDPQRELLAGNFQVDLVCEDENGDRPPADAVADGHGDSPPATSDRVTLQTRFAARQIVG